MKLPIIGRVENLDADQTIFFKRSLEFVKAKSYDVKYPSLMIQNLFPVSTEAGIAASSITYEQFDTVGMMKFISDYSDDLPRSDVKGKQFTVTVQSLGGSYGWSLQEVRAAAMANRPLTQMRAMASRRSNDQMVNKIGWFADGSAKWAGLVGIIYNANVTKAAAPVGAWLTGPKTPDQIIGDVNFGIQKSNILTNGVEVCDTCLLPVEQYAHIATTPRSSTSDTTILEFLRRVNPGVTFAQVNELKNVNPNPRTGALSNTNVMVCYTRSPDHLQLEQPIIYEQFPAQERNLAYVIPVHSRIAGFNVYYPLSITVVDGL